MRRPGARALGFRLHARLSVQIVLLVSITWVFGPVSDSGFRLGVSLFFGSVR
jgi:hypothetical protein